MSSTIEDISYLTRSEHRVGVLVAVAARPRSRSELGEITGASSSTIRRTLRDFEDRNWVRRDGYQYETTDLGEFIAGAMVDLLDRFETERQLRSVWEFLPESMSGFSLDMCLDARVTVSAPEDPYRPVSRFTDLLETTDAVRFAGFDVAMLEPSRSALCDRIVEGMATELIAPPRVVQYIRTTYPEEFQEALASGNLTVRVHEELPPYGVGVFDERIAIACYDSEGVTVRVLIDTAGEDCIEWAESVYDRYSRQTPTLPI